MNGSPTFSRKSLVLAFVGFGLFLWMGLGVVSVNPHALGAVLLSLWIILALLGWGTFQSLKSSQVVSWTPSEKKTSPKPGEEKPENLLNVLWQSVKEGVLVLDKTDRVERLNPAAEKILRVQENEVSGRHALEVVRDARLMDLLDEAKKKEQSLQGEMEWGPQKENVFEVTVIPLFSREAGKKRVGTAVVWEDVTERRKLLRQRTEFVANVSHELKTPLSALLAAVETLQTQEPEDPNIRKRFIGIIGQQAFRLKRLIQDVLDLSHAESGEWPEKLQPVDVADSLRPVLEALETAAREKNVHFKVEWGSLRSVRAFPQGLQHVWLNLLDNALRYAPAGSAVTVRSEVRGKVLRVEVQDKGPGIAEEHLPRLFERFYRVDPSRSREEGGTGLGLAVVKHLVEKMGGQVGVESRLGAGSTFWVELNRAEEKEK